MVVERPDLSGVAPDVRAYIEFLENELLQSKKKPRAVARVEAPPPEPSEPPTPINIITMNKNGFAKRTPRHHYFRQRRGGMGVFDLETDENVPPTLLATADESADMIAVTDEGRVFRVATSTLTETPVRGRGEELASKMQLLIGEKVVAILPADAGLYLTLVSQRGWVRHVRNTYLGKSMIQGIRYHKVSQGGRVTSACWSDGNSDILIATRKGKGIRFSEKQIPGTGCLGIRIDPSDEAIAVTATNEAGGVFVLGVEGKGSIRLMRGFRKNKAPGAGGKVLLKTDRLLGAQAVDAGDDIFVISQLSKLIRFSADEVPQKEGVVQGVHCINLRNDEAMAFTVARLP